MTSCIAFLLSMLVAFTLGMLIAGQNANWILILISAFVGAFCGFFLGEANQKWH